MKKCTKCGIEKPVEMFWKDKSKKHGHCAVCKSCKTVVYSIYRKKNGYDKKRYQKHKESERERHLVRKYGITLVEYNQMYRKQNGKCAICGKEQINSFDVDHNHKTGEVRGLLCTNCNRMIGHANDSPERLNKGAEYLLSRKSRRSL